MWNFIKNKIEKWVKPYVISFEGDEYLRRYRIIRLPFLRVYVHNILRSDRDRHLHDHPWSFWTLILEGKYREHMLDGVVERGKGSIGWRPATSLHRVEIVEPAWTLVVCGPKWRTWGFLGDNNQWIPNDKYEDRGENNEVVSTNRML